VSSRRNPKQKFDVTFNVLEHFSYAYTVSTLNMSECLEGKGIENLKGMLRKVTLGLISPV